MLVGGTPLNEIASRLRLSEKTVANYQSTIKQKLGVSNAIQLMHKALQLGLVSGHLAVGAQPGG
jgi:DNA-binding NarL/FixJ family response regulator